MFVEVFRAVQFTTTLITEVASTAVAINSDIINASSAFLSCADSVLTVTLRAVLSGLVVMCNMGGFNQFVLQVARSRRVTFDKAPRMFNDCCE